MELKTDEIWESLALGIRRTESQEGAMRTSKFREWAQEEELQKSRKDELQTKHEEVEMVYC